ncbi:MAG: hypothetical protein CMC08_06255 [Flavobacteriaceae bacterium]|nr:hypothetical protein [Flavobacteriaceae bacterium]
MKKDEIDILFENMRECFDIHETPTGHQKRFLEKFHSQKSQQEKRTWWKPLSVAASVAAIALFATFLLKSEPAKADLASVSPEMEKTQSFFTSAINKELRTLKNYNSPEAKALVEDAMAQIATLEQEYQSLTIDLAESGNDKRVVYAMISNFQNRIELLEQVIQTLDEIKELKAYRNETTI